MRSWVGWVLALALLLSLSSPPACAEQDAPQKLGALNLTPSAMQVLDEYDGVTSATHAWLALDVILQSFELEPLDLGTFSATLSYQGKYEYLALPPFETDLLEPLVEQPCALVFKVPNLVARADASELALAVSWEGEACPVALRCSGARPADALSGSVFFENPQDAVVFFVDRIRQADFEGALSAGASASMAEGYSLTGMANRLSVLMPTMAMTLPSEYAPYVPLNRLGSLAQMRMQLNATIQSLLVAPEMADGLPRVLKDGNFDVQEGQSLSLEDYIALLDPQRLSGLELIGVYRVDSELYRSEANQRNMQRQGEIYGYTDFADFAMVYQLEGQLYQHTCQLAKFDKGWQITSLNSPILGLSAFGNPERISDSDFRSIDQNASDFVRLYPEA